MTSPARGTGVRRRRVRVAAAVATLTTALTLTACSNSTKTGDDRVKTADDKLVCGLLSPDLVHEVVPADDVKTTGGFRSAAQRKVQPAECTVTDASTYTAKIQVAIGEVTDPAQWKATLAKEARSATGVAKT